MSLQSEAVGVSEWDTTTLRVINTDALVFLRVWGGWMSAETCRVALTTRVVIPYGLTELLSTRDSASEVTHGVDVWSGGDHFSRGGGGRVTTCCWYCRLERFLAGCC